MLAVARVAVPALVRRRQVAAERLELARRRRRVGGLCPVFELVNSQPPGGHVFAQIVDHSFAVAIGGTQTRSFVAHSGNCRRSADGNVCSGG